MAIDMIGSSPKFRAVLTEVARVATQWTPAVWIQGETGTGKEVIARAIHETSRRRHNRFVALNCAAIPSALLERASCSATKGQRGHRGVHTNQGTVSDGGWGHALSR